MATARKTPPKKDAPAEKPEVTDAPTVEETPAAATEPPAEDETPAVEVVAPEPAPSVAPLTPPAPRAVVDEAPLAESPATIGATKAVERSNRIIDAATGEAPELEGLFEEVGATLRRCTRRLLAETYFGNHATTVLLIAKGTEVHRDHASRVEAALRAQLDGE